MIQEERHQHIFSLPNEVFVQILTPFSTRTLLPLARVCHRFHALVLRILHYRLLTAASLKEDKLILECFHPSSKLTEPHVFCTYLGTDGLGDGYEGGSLYENVDPAECLGRLGSLYSRFRPENNENDTQDKTVRRIINLDDTEDFSQLCVMANLVKVLAGRNRLLSAITVDEGIIRVWRDWLKRQSTADSSQPTASNDPRDQSILWVDKGRNIGLKVRARESQTESLPVLVHRDDLSVTYEVDIEEFYVRTTRLLLAVEQALEEQKNYTKAVIFGAYPV
ncbi:hypothetical protein ASPZODRAFT_97334 [Penicilliopsis zonata CBS 506.65]|uniref:F-box domain-containing protein n=1 Tax=Penicilliopsis zonata CBS 506.65 TaxID=1073090 RepID=A0A1L9SIC5_9EURO|nr:hypothetical protein ASPZODRAFT_97334 [Penicilliopsis zonata CBS 506.65]OJJ46784.1 hypothetical protein ASPZODRAFT_97334 [Penicilliopsis zonata CBS 506.65]